MVVYTQAFLHGARLCKLCMAPVTFCSLPPQVILPPTSIRDSCAPILCHLLSPDIYHTH